MTHLKSTVVLSLLVLTQACALEADDTQPSPGSAGASQPSHTTGGAPTGARCERLDDLGLAATGVVLHKSNPIAEDAPCLDLQGNRIASFAGRACRLATPESFALTGCVDTYDCEGCTIEVRSDDVYGFVARGTSESATCADLAAKYALVTGLACDAQIDHL